ncbi:imidazole glycerol phosphate synthase subunit HisH [Flavobacterium sp. F-65]|uniref:Imidazole glycerol phosphate synthase subunit HisH n=1 Tax=Flavobacterium pisciphilum TaxID=2893755 RepID=A0ABS8MV27_9FLAO|nr:imidazole glycerol phosphate synthase subunit HisH [Flavobacterium sp. F-65]MCC9071730.1 imidazole glycerol phosphate synthase subunit HisH [Flavobacterium sp. F-65]
MKIVIADYGMGNIKSIVSTLNYLGVGDIVISADFNVLNSADKIILPGVGSFGKAMAQIKENSLDKYLKEIVVEKGKPLIGICLGMQLLGNSSTEDGFTEGLGFVNAHCIKFDNTDLKVPHVGFNQLKIDNKLKIYDGLPSEADFYFTHSYKMVSEDEINQSYCNYGSDFIASFECNNIVGVQFHPELSQNNGLRLLKNFIEKF